MKFIKKPAGRGLGQVIQDMDSVIDSVDKKNMKRNEKHSEKAARNKAIPRPSPQSAEIAGGDETSNRMAFGKLRKRALKMYLSFKKDLSPAFPTVRDIAYALVKTRQIRRVRVNHFVQTISKWAAKDRWEYYRDMVKQRAIDSCKANKISFRIATSAEIQRVLKTLNFTHEYLNQSIILDTVYDRSAILSHAIIDSIVINKLASQVFSKLASDTISGRTLGGKEKLPVAANEAHQFWTTSHKNLLNFVAPKIAEGKVEESVVGSGLETTPLLLTPESTLMILQHKSEESAERGNKHGISIQEAPNNNDFTKFNKAGCEEAFIISQEGSHKGSKK